MSGPQAKTIGRIPFEPALEGLRGLALLGTICFHSEFGWATGGFLAISTFFSLSGFLITSLFLVEWEQTGSLRLGHFWARRFRRLMPASLLTLAGISLFAALVADSNQLERLREEVFSALFYVANWYFLVSDTGYAQLFSAPSPVLHFWSLTIEEQFYFVFPMIALAGLWLGKGSRSAFAGMLGVLIAASVLASVMLTTSGATDDRVYYGSDTRAAELLLGGMAALLLCGRKFESAAVRRLVDGLGVASFVAILAIWASVTLHTQWLYLGGFAAYSLLSVSVIAAAVQPSGVVRALFSGRVIRWAGRVSYGAYLFHWPIFLWLSEERTGLSTLSLFALRLFVTLIVAELSYRYFEAPIRSGRVLTGWRPFVVVPAAFAVVIGATAATTTGVGISVAGYDPTIDVRELEAFVARAEAGRLGEDEAREQGPPDAPSLTRARPRVSIFGDSSSLMLGIGFQYYMGRRTDRVQSRRGLPELGCAIARHGRYRSRGEEMTRPNHCVKRGKAWREVIEDVRPDIALVFSGSWDVCDRKLAGDTQWRAPGDPILDDYLREEMLQAVDILAADGALVLWLTHPAIETRGLGGKVPEVPFPESDPARMRRYNELIRELEALRPGKVRVVDLARHMLGLPGGEMDPVYRPDGTHFSLEGALRITDDWVGEEVLRFYREAGARAAID